MTHHLNLIQNIFLLINLDLFCNQHRVVITNQSSCNKQSEKKKEICKMKLHSGQVQKVRNFHIATI